MNLITCKCGKSKQNFRFLTVEDMGTGWEGECCSETPKVSEPKAAPKKPGRPKKQQPRVEDEGSSDI